MLRHDVVRFGEAAAVVDRLADLAGIMQGRLATARADHAVGIVAADPGRLTAAVDVFEAAGSPLLAAEAALDLADLGIPGAAERARALRGRLAPAVVTPRLSRAS
jgi:hypothetical protein